jgi:hypothetical protein
MLIVGWGNDDADHFIKMSLFRSVGPSLQPREVGLFLGIGCMVPQPYAAGGNRSYPGVLGRNQWPAVPRLNYPDMNIAIFSSMLCQ